MRNNKTHKRKFSNRVISICVIIALVVTLSPISAFADDWDDFDTEDSIIVTLDPAGGHISKSTLTVGESAVSLPKPTKSGWKFTGWYIYDEYGGSDYDGGYEKVPSTVSYYNLEADEYGYCDLTAGWTKSAKVKFNANKGKISKKSKTVKYSNLEGVSTYGKLPSPKRSGYMFKGWYTKKKGGEQITAEDDVLRSKTHTVYAHWKKIPARWITKSEYKKIKYGMTYSQVCKIIGGKGYSKFYSYAYGKWYWDTVTKVYVGSKYGTVKCYWDTAKLYDEDEFGACIVFNHGKAIEKANFGI
jgi:uncharacterized repeat protein (TIGR02543 family)